MAIVTSQHYSFETSFLHTLFGLDMKGFEKKLTNVISVVGSSF